MEIETKINQKYELVKIPEGMYQATLKEIKDGGKKTFAVKNKDGTTAKNDDGTDQTKEVKKLLFLFEVSYNPALTPVRLAFGCYPPATEENKLGQALLAMGIKIDGKPLSSEALLGKMAKVTVENYKRKVKDEFGAERIFDYFTEAYRELKAQCPAVEIFGSSIGRVKEVVMVNRKNKETKHDTN